MENNIDYEKLLADEAKAHQEAETAAKAEAAAEKQRRLELEKQRLEELCKKDYDWWGNTRDKLPPEQVDLNARRHWLKEYMRGERLLYPFPSVVPEELGEWIADTWEKVDKVVYRKQCPEITSLPEQIQKIVQARQEKREAERKNEEAEWEAEQRGEKEKERKQRESARWAWENGRKKRLLKDKSNTELLAMIELNLREISYWLEHHAFKRGRY